jgi:signal transduction histidine kinase
MALTAARARAVTIRLDRDPAQACRARHQARAAVADWGLGEVADLAELIVGELVANALRHGAGPIEVGLSGVAGGLRIAVHDDGAGRPVRRRPGDQDECGRGLALLEDLIVPLGGTRGMAADAGGPGKTVYVVLPSVPADGFLPGSDGRASG